MHATFSADVRSLRSRLVASVLLAGALLGCGGDETTGAEEDHDPASVKLFSATGQELTTTSVPLAAGQTTRIEVRLFADDGDRIASLPAGHGVALIFSPTDLATVTPVAGQQFTFDVAARASGGLGTATVGYGHNGNTTERTFGPYQVAVSPQQATVRFAAQVNGASFACGQSYTNVGTTRSTVRPSEWRFYVHRVRLLKADGSEVPLTLTQDGKWQRDDLALLDFENGTGPCSNGTADLNDRVVGTVPADTYTGVRFVLGVPFAKNHIDPATALSPLSLTALSWAWNSGYMFMRIDLTTTGLPGGYFVHLGSTGCNGATGTSAPTACLQPNRVEVTLTGFNPATSIVAADVGALLANSNVDINQGGPGGCMSGTTDGDCPPVFAGLGLPFNGGPSPTSQTFFRIVQP